MFPLYLCLEFVFVPGIQCCMSAKVIHTNFVWITFAEVQHCMPGTKTNTYAWHKYECQSQIHIENRLPFWNAHFSIWYVLTFHRMKFKLGCKRRFVLQSAVNAFSIRVHLLHFSLNFILWNVKTYQMEKCSFQKGNLFSIWCIIFPAYGIAILTSQFRKFKLFLSFFVSSDWNK